MCVSKFSVTIVRVAFSFVAIAVLDKVGVITMRGSETGALVNWMITTTQIIAIMIRSNGLLTRNATGYASTVFTNNVPVS